jgi:hypothetical protein
MVVARIAGARIRDAMFIWVMGRRHYSLFLDIELITDWVLL